MENWYMENGVLVIDKPIKKRGMTESDYDRLQYPVRREDEY
jgi:hypothetical protein